MHEPVEGRGREFPCYTGGYGDAGGMAGSLWAKESQRSDRRKKKESGSILFSFLTCPIACRVPMDFRLSLSPTNSTFSCTILAAVAVKRLVRWTLP